MIIHSLPHILAILPSILQQSPSDPLRGNGAAMKQRDTSVTSLFSALLVNESLQNPCVMNSIPVGGWPTPLKNMKVSWDDYSQYMEKKACSKPPTSIILAGGDSPFLYSHHPQYMKGSILPQLIINQRFEHCTFLW